MRIDDLPLRFKILGVAVVPVILLAGMVLGAFSFGLENVWRDTLPRQTSLLLLESLSREYQSEVREFLFTGSESTRLEMEEIEERVPGTLHGLAAQSPEGNAIVMDLNPLFELLMEEGQRVSSMGKARQVPLQGSEMRLLGKDLERFEAVETQLEQRIQTEKELTDRQVAAAFQQFRWSILGCLAFGVLVAGGLAVYLVRLVSHPLAVLSEASERILDGDYNAGERLQRNDELGRLAQGFDRAAQDIREALEERQTALDTLRESQDQLLQTSKLAAVGELAAGVAHEINNPLSAVLTYGVLLREKAERASPEVSAALPKLVERLQRIEDAARRCQSIADKLLTFAHQDTTEKSSVALEEVVEDSIDLLKPSLRHHQVSVETVIEADLPNLWAHAGQLQQVMINLINNAMQAQPSGGSVRIAACRAGDDCVLEVADRGPGIDPSVLTRVFEPFVTTKPVGEGTGLGLSIVYGIVQDHGGEITVESEVGAGATFTIRLPLAADA